MASMWLPSAKKRAVGNTSAMNGGAKKATWHATANIKADGKDNAFQLESNYFATGGKGSAPHLIWDPFTGEIAQYFPANSRALALRNYGSAQTNRSGTYNIQIEVVFCTGQVRGGKKYNHISETPCKNLDKIMAWLNSLGIAKTWPGGAPTGWHRDTVSWATYHGKSGHYGHHQVPGNDHVDPGKMPNLFGKPKPKAPAKVVPKKKPSKVTGPITSGTYKVVAGDTLWGISHRSTRRIEEIQAWNGIAGNNIKIGQTLRLTAPPDKGDDPEHYTTVHKGDTVWRLARKFKTTVAKIVGWNKLKNNKIVIGQRLKIKALVEKPRVLAKAKPKPKVWIWSNVGPGQTNNSVKIVQKALIAEKCSIPAGATGFWGAQTTKAYAKWQRICGYSGADADGRPGKKSLKALGKKQKFTLKNRPKPKAKVSKGGRAATPVPGHGINYPYGVPNSGYAAGFHTGEDRAAPTRTPAVAVRAGRVRHVAGGAYGNVVVLEADNGRDYWYCHLNSRSVGHGKYVKAGNWVGRVGSTGNSTGPHLHFEDRPRGGGYGQVRKPSW